MAGKELENWNLGFLDLKYFAVMTEQIWGG